MKNQINILFSGDFVPDLKYADNEKFLCSGLNEKFRDADLHITNLESPLTHSKKKILKSGPHLKKTPGDIELIKKAGINIACLANNHIFDYGEEGLIDTIKVCEENKIETLGINYRSDKKPSFLIKELKNRKIGFLNYCEHEFSVREIGKIGANGYDSEKAFYDIKELKNKCDYVIVIYHGGIEYYTLPRPGIKRTFRYLTDAGADAVISHHTHTLSGYEIYNGKPIIYGLGNFYFPYENEPDEWYTGLICDLSLTYKISFILHPVRQSEDFNKIELLTGKEKEKIDKIISTLNNIIADDNKLTEEWEKYVSKVKTGYLKQILNLKRYEKALLKFGLFKNKILNSGQNIKIKNLISCESHREILLKILNKSGKY